MKTFAQIVFTLGIFAVTSAHSSAKSQCAEATKDTTSASHGFILDQQSPLIPLHLVPPRPLSHHPLYMGYEVLKISEPLFKDPEKIRAFVNSHEDGANHVGERVLHVHGTGDRSHREMPTSAEIFEAIQKEFPSDVATPLIQYVNEVLKDGAHRQHRFSKFLMTLRTERYPLGFQNGHSHAGGDLNYATAPIGLNTEVDLKNRYIEGLAKLPEQDYFTTVSPLQILVFGGVWHRTPQLKPGESRLYVLIELIP